MRRPNDKEELVLNPVTGQLDVVVRFDADRIVTHATNAADNPVYSYDPVLGQHVPMDFLVVTDANGNVVVN